MARYSDRSCECNTCSICRNYNYICALVDDTERLLNKDDYTYEDFAHSARYLLERWIATKT